MANPNWQLGFSVIYLKPVSGEVQWFPVFMTNEGFFWKGCEYCMQDKGVNTPKRKAA